MGAKLFAWIGGLALFLGVAFFVKYSFEHNLIPPELRVAIGFAVGLTLLSGGVLLKRKENAVTAQTLCATGILVLYSVTFACRAYYHFALFGLVPTFLLMTLITAVAFLLAVRMNAIVVAVLGIAGGFLTPVLLSTGQDNPLALFGFIALLDMGLLEPPLHADFVMGVVGGIPASARNLAAMADNLPAGGHHWGVIGIGRDQWMLVAAALTLGGSIRVGLEDNFYLPDGQMARSNGELIAKARQMAEDVGRRPATVAEARRMLAIPQREVSVA